MYDEQRPVLVHHVDHLHIATVRSLTLNQPLLIADATREGPTCPSNYKFGLFRFDPMRQEMGPIPFDPSKLDRLDHV
jgi:hypothetical protein